MEEPLIIAQRRFDGERDNVTREKQKLVEKRNRLDSEIALHRESIERLATEASRKFVIFEAEPRILNRHTLLSCRHNEGCERPRCNAEFHRFA